jgi:H-type small acid-soluble spore protein
LDASRAQQVIDSLGVIEVRHQGESVWIEEIDGKMAQVKYLNTRKHARVPVTELEEIDSYL